MPYGGNQRVRSDHYVIANIYFPDIENGQVVIAGKIVADKNLFAVVAVEGLADPDFLADTSQHGF